MRQGGSRRESAPVGKILVIGDGGVGKTTLITRFTEQYFLESYTATIGVDFKSRLVTVEGKSLKMQIWDTAGQERFRNITQAYFKGASGILLAYSVIDQQSFENLQKWMTQVQQTAPDQCRLLLVGTKTDCNQRVVDRKEAEQFAGRVRVKYFQTSAKSGEGVDEAFMALAKQVMEGFVQEQHKNGKQIKINSASEKQENKKCSC